jgi:RNA polymerase sigma-70 factor, ECF subfamily
MVAHDSHSRSGETPAGRALGDGPSSAVRHLGAAGGKGAAGSKGAVVDRDPVPTAVMGVIERGNGSGDGILADEELLQRFRSGGDESAFEALVHRYERELFSYLRRYLGSAEMAEDVFQATFLQVYLKKEGFEEGRRFRPWLYTIATNQAIDAQRRNRRHRMVSLDQRTGDDDVGALVEMLAGRDQTADDRMAGEEAKEWVRSAVQDLPDALRSALVLVYHQGMKYREAADVLGIPVGTVKSRLHSALLKLNESWQSGGKSL